MVNTMRCCWPAPAWTASDWVTGSPSASIPESSCRLRAKGRSPSSSAPPDPTSAISSTIRWIRTSSRCVVAERELARAIGADCALPLGAHCQTDGALRLTAVAADADATHVLRVVLTGDDPVALGGKVAARLEALGARELLGT